MTTLDLEQYDYLMKKLTNLVRLAYHSANYAHKYALSENDYSRQASLAYATRASAFITSAEVMYYCNFEINQRYDFDNLFLAFDTFISELLDAYATDHSVQWTGIEFDALEQLYQNSIFADNV